jgi:thioredoxin 1
MAIHITDANWEELVAGDVPVMMDFWAEWCAPCRALSPLVEEMAVAYENKVIVGKVNVDDSPNITMKFGIKNIPTLIFFKGGEVVDKHVGSIKAAELSEKLDKLL